MARREQGGSGIEAVETAGKRQFQPVGPATVPVEQALVAEQLQIAVGLIAEILYRRPAAHFEHGFQVGIAGTDDGQPVARENAHQVVKLPLDRVQIVEDVRMIELEIVQYQAARTVVQELTALVEEGGVVFVGFDDEERRRAETGRDAEVPGQAADQETGLEPGLLEDPGQQAGRGGLAVGAGHGQHPAFAQQMFGQPLRTGDVVEPAFEDDLDLFVAPRQGVADDVEIGVEIKVVGAVAVAQLDAGGGQLIAHRWIDGGIRAEYFVTHLARQHRDAGHEGAADAEDVDLHGRLR